MRNIATILILPAALAAVPAAAQEAEPFTGPSVVAVAGIDHVGNEDFNDNGLLYGGALTYDLAAGRLRYGVEAEVTGSTRKGCESSVAVTGDRACFHTGRDLYIGGRLGAVVADNLMLYGKAGYTNARSGGTYDDPATTASPDFRGSENYGGYRVGAGAELNAGNFLVRTEYRYSDYDGLAGGRHQGTVGLGFRF